MDTTNQLLTRREVAERIGVSVSSLDRLRRHDPDFPEPIRIAVTGTQPLLRWEHRDIEGWILTKHGPAALLPELDAYWTEQARRPTSRRPGR